MILRRLSQSLKEQNWTTIWIEFVLLVGGVFLGIQAANWNAAQQDHKLEAEFIGRLSRDFGVIDARLSDSISRWEEIATTPLRILADIETFRRDGSWPRPKAELLADMGTIFNSRIPAPRAATYIELLSAGKLGLIRNTRLRDALLEYDMQVGYTQTAFNVLVQRTDPHMTTIISHLEFDRSNTISNIQIDAKNEAVWADVDLEQLAADPNLKVALNMYASSSRNQMLVAKLQQKKALDVVALLKSDARRAEGKQP